MEQIDVPYRRLPVACATLNDLALKRGVVSPGESPQARVIINSLDKANTAPEITERRSVPRKEFSEQ